MDRAAKRTVRAKIYDFLTTRMVYHSLFWGIMFLTFIALDLLSGGSHSGIFYVTKELINVFFFGVIVYFNLFYLIPNYLSEKKFLLYCGMLIGAALVITPIKVIIFYFMHSNNPMEQQTLVHDLNWGFITNFFVAGSSTIFKIINDWVRHQRERTELETQTMQSELRFLKSQINPHFLFNTLNNLYALTLKKSDKAPEIVIKLSEMMRYMLYECNEKKVFLDKEVNYIKNYLDLERLRQGKNVTIDFEITGEIQNQKIAPLLFIPFLENSFKHGLNNQISRGFVNIVLELKNRNQIELFIENSKPETLPLKDHRRSGGIGLVNVRRRLNILYPNSYELKIKDNPKTYAVNLKVDLN